MLNPFYFLWVCGFRADHYVLDLIESTYKSMSNELFMGAEMIQGQLCQQKAGNWSVIHSLQTAQQVGVSSW